MSDETKLCPYCGEQILAIAIKCKHCSSMLEDIQKTGKKTSCSIMPKPAADYGIFLLAIPVVATMLIFFWVSEMNLLQSPSDTMNLIMIATIVGTAIVASMEAGKVGMKTDRSKGTYSATSWFFIITMMWIVGYPVYLFKRKHFGLENRLVLGLFVTLLFLGSWGVMFSAIESKKIEIRDNLELKLGQDYTSTKNVFKLGDYGPGKGIIFYVDSSGQHGLEAQSKDANVGGTVASEYTSNIYPDGSSQHFYTWEQAKTVASSYSVGWRLPTKDELNLLYQQKDVVGGFDGGGSNYWSSTEYSADIMWYQDFYDGSQINGNKASYILVRAVRDF